MKKDCKKKEFTITGKPGELVKFCCLKHRKLLAGKTLQTED